MCFKGTASRIGGVGFEQIARDALALHAAAYNVSMGQANRGRDSVALHAVCCPSSTIDVWSACLTPSRPLSPTI
jgi:hypothetical protein